MVLQFFEEGKDVFLVGCCGKNKVRLEGNRFLLNLGKFKGYLFLRDNGIYWGLMGFYFKMF